MWARNCSFVEAFRYFCISSEAAGLPKPKGKFQFPQRPASSNMARSFPMWESIVLYARRFGHFTLGYTLKFGVGTPMTVYHRFAVPVLPNQETIDISRAGRKDCVAVRKRRQEGFKFCAKLAFLLRV